MSIPSGFKARFSETLRLTLVYRLARELNAELRPVDVLHRVLNAAAEALGTPYASIAAFRDKELQAAYAIGGGAVDPLPVIKRVLADGLAGFVLHNYRTVIINDINRSPLWLPLDDEPLSPQEGSALCMPLIHAGEVVGVITLAHPAPGYFSADAVNLTTTISELGAAALSNALLLDATRRAERRYEVLFDDATVPIIITDLQGHIQAINRRTCEFLGYTPEDLLHKNITTVHREGTEPVGADHFDHLKRGLEVRFQSMAWAKDGSKYPVQVYARRINSDGDVDCVQWIEHDMSIQMELDRLRRDLSAMIYHDVRGPLSNVYSSLEALSRLLARHPDQNVQDLIEVASRSEDQARRMIDSLLDVQYLEEGRRLLSRTNVMINELIVEVVKQLEHAARENNIFLDFDLADDPPVLYIDSGMIERVVFNLVDNAIKYAPRDGAVIISTVIGKSEVYVRVKDNGPGIPHEALELIFDKFSRVKQRNMPHGVGLGLAFCKLAVEAHGGRIWVRSDNRRGSTFTFALPIEAPGTQELPLLGPAAAH